MFEPGSQVSVPQQSPSELHELPAAWHAHVLLDESHRSAPQQSELLAHAWPTPLHAQVLLEGSQSSAPQQSPLDWQPCAARAQPHDPFTHCAEQQSDALVHGSPSSTHAPPPSAPPSPPLPPPHVKVVWSQRRAPQQSKSVTQSLP